MPDIGLLICRLIYIFDKLHSNRTQLGLEGSLDQELNVAFNRGGITEIRRLNFDLQIKSDQSGYQDQEIGIMRIQHKSSELRTEPISKCNFAIQNIIITSTRTCARRCP